MKTFQSIFDFPLTLERAVRSVQAEVRYFIWLPLLLAITFIGCKKDEETPSEPSEFELATETFEQLTHDPAYTVVSFPQQDPGFPLYARVTPISNQFLVADGKLIIPFFRNPDCIPPEFNLLDFFNPPEAFGCELTLSGRFVIENENPPDIFPFMAHSSGSAVPFWIVDWESFQTQIQDGSITIAELEALNPVKATATQFDEYLWPRLDDHKVVIEAEGIIDGTTNGFSFSLIHKGDEIHDIKLVMQ